MVSSLSNFVHNLAERNCKNKCIDCDWFHEHKSIKDNVIKCKCASSNKHYSNKIVVKKSFLSLWIYGWMEKV